MLFLELCDVSHVRFSGEKPYVNLAYQAGNFEIIAHSDLKNKVSGVTAMYTIKKW